VKRGTQVFINYRRKDTMGYALALSCHLTRRRFRRDEVFMDLSSIRPGSDYKEAIRSSIESSKAILVVIGNDWLVDSDGRRRLDDPGDLLRVEIKTALEAGKVVIPVLVGAARMPERHQLPNSLVALADRNAIELTDGGWDDDIGRLVSELRRLAPAGRLVHVTFRVRVPEDTPGDAHVHIAGSIGSLGPWDPGRQPLRSVGRDTWEASLDIPEQTRVEYKYTLGSWERVEEWGSLTGLANRSVDVRYGANGEQIVDDTAATGPDIHRAVQAWRSAD
jgi:hypothetical protein